MKVTKKCSFCGKPFVTRSEHLERNDFIIEKQKEEMKRLDATRLYREHQLEMANRKMQEAESITIERLQCKIQTMQNDHHRERMELEAKHLSELNRREAAHTEENTRLKNRISWQNHIIGSLSFLLLKTSDIFRKAVNSVIRLAKDYYKPRFDTEQVSDIKSALNLFGDDKQLHRAAGDFLYITASQKGKLDNREQIKAKREFDNVVEGQYDQQQKRGFSMRR